MAEPGRLNQQTIRFPLAQQGIQPHLHRQAVDAAHTAAGNFFEQGAAIGQQSAIDTHFAKLINQHGPFFICRLVGQQMKNRGRFTAAEKPRDQVGFGHIFSRIQM